MSDTVILRTSDKEPESQEHELIPLPDDDRLIPASLLSRYIGLAVQTLARHRHEGKGPPFVRVGRRIFYRSSDVRSWLERNSFNATSSY